MRRGRAAAISLLALAGVASPSGGVWAEAEAEAEVGEGTGLAQHLRSSPGLLGDPAGVRGALDRLGIRLQLVYNQFLSAKDDGGADGDSGFGHSGSYDFFARVDLEELVSWRGADLLLHVKGQYDRNLNTEVGALSSPIDDADFDEGIYVDELWLQQAFFADRLRLRLGFLEHQTVFDRNAYANSEDRQFLSTFLDNNPVVPLPNGLGATLVVEPIEGVELALGAADADNLPRDAGFDTAFDDIDSVTALFELSLRSPLEARELPGRYRFGFFVDGRRKLDFRSGRSSRGHLGGYLGFDQLVHREEPGGSQGLGLFARAGYADEEVNRIAWFWSAGLQYEGLLPTRGADVLGLGAYQAIGSDTYRDEVDRRFRRETGIELYYLVRVLPWLDCTPDFQYIVDPGATGADDVLVATLRFRVRF